jgi:hypothetical protein
MTAAIARPIPHPNQNFWREGVVFGDFCPLKSREGSFGGFYPPYNINAPTKESRR